MSNPPPPRLAIDLGHEPVWDPIFTSAKTERWTCPCGMAILRHGHVLYGSAGKTPCPRKKAQ